MAPMRTVEEIRQLQLLKLIESAGSIQAVAEKMGKSHSQISQLKTMALHSTTGKRRMIGSDLAREFEAKFDKEVGWMDHEPASDAEIQQLSAWLVEIRALDPQRFEQLASGIEKLLISMRTTDEILRTQHGVTGYTSPARAHQVLGTPKKAARIRSVIDEGGLIGGMSGFGDLQELGGSK
jgi:hypothetical protein